MRYYEWVERHERDFKGVWIPRDIWLSEQLSMMEKVLFVEIHSLDNARGCFASNAYFAEFFQVSSRQISRYIASLREKGFVTVTMVTDFERVIRTVGKYRRVPQEDIHRLQKQQHELVHRMRVGARRG